MSRRALTREDRRLWGRVERTLDKTRARPAEPEPPTDPEPRTPPRFVRPARPPAQPAPPPTAPARPAAHAAPHDLEPRRHRRLARERDPIEARIDLHGHGRFQAQDALTAFLMNAHASGYRSVLVVTGKGARSGGVGVIRSSVMDWVAQPPLRAIVAGIASAHRRHGGEGAFYVTLRR
ncbi:MAG TPA: Smr/MutS family protein [Brevundimonas sp.]|jgi:DNA-nicking Smr family endonuclease|uniref:Smr/MutS family protein n=1 Tax=Brevundimonas sp. TaxID=1871086 RepID=UPI002CB56255|nr:Smr/MutS family protein [Brevundimonas sp.]HRH21171.1 Smr/MutS family protein [Brevundimonas sp.]